MNSKHRSSCRVAIQGIVGVKFMPDLGLSPSPKSFAQFSNPAFAKSAGVMAILNSTAASNVKNHGSANAGIYGRS